MKIVFLTVGTWNNHIYSSVQLSINENKASSLLLSCGDTLLLQWCGGVLTHPSVYSEHVCMQYVFKLYKHINVLCFFDILIIPGVHTYMCVKVRLWYITLTCDSSVWSTTEILGCLGDLSDCDVNKLVHHFQLVQANVSHSYAQMISTYSYSVTSSLSQCTWGLNKNSWLCYLTKSTHCTETCIHTPRRASFWFKLGRNHQKSKKQHNQKWLLWKENLTAASQVSQFIPVDISHHFSSYLIFLF